MKDKEVKEWVEVQKAGNRLMMRGVIWFVASLLIVMFSMKVPLVTFVALMAMFFYVSASEWTE